MVDRLAPKPTYSQLPYSQLAYRIESLIIVSSSSFVQQPVLVLGNLQWLLRLAAGLMAMHLMFA